jgi:hypothetical protein
MFSIIKRSDASPGQSSPYPSESAWRACRRKQTSEPVSGGVGFFNVTPQWMLGCALYIIQWWARAVIGV